MTCNGLYDTFSALVGLDASAGENSGAEFVVLGDGKELWRSGVLKKSDEPRPVQISITGCAQTFVAHDRRR